MPAECWLQISIFLVAGAYVRPIKRPGGAATALQEDTHALRAVAETCHARLNEKLVLHILPVGVRHGHLDDPIRERVPVLAGEVSRGRQAREPRLWRRRGKRSAIHK